MNYQRLLRRITIGFVVLLVFLTFFSRTLLDLHVPRVTLAFAAQGIISPQAISSGIVAPADTERVFAPVSGRITQIMERGDTTNANSILFTITSDMDTLVTMLEQAMHELRVNELNIERETSSLNNARQRHTQLMAEPLTLPTAPTLNLWEYDIQLENNAASITAAENDVATSELLYTQGVIPRQDVLNRQTTLARLLQARDEIAFRRNLAIERYETAAAAHEEGIAAVQRTRTEQIQAQQNIINGHSFQITALNMERERIDRRVYDLTEQIEEGGTAYVRLPEDRPANRIITEVMHGIEIGSFVSEGSPVLTTAIRNNRFIIEVPFPQSQDFISVRQNADVVVGTHRIEGTTTRVVPDGGRNIVSVEIQSSQLVGGEMARVTVHGGVSSAQNVIPISALQEDQTGYFIMFVSAQERRFGSDYYVRVLQVEVDRRDERNAAVSARWGTDMPEEPIIVNSDMPIRAGIRVRLVGGNEFAPTR